MKHGMKAGKKRPERFYSWLNGVVFHKNLGLMKLSYDDKRSTECVDHQLKCHERPALLPRQLQRYVNLRSKVNKALSVPS